MRLLDRRIGLLFAIFFLLLLAAAGRAAWLGGVRADDLGERAAAQQAADLEVPARRGTITDRNGVELAVSEDAATVFANPFLVKDPVRAAAQLARVLDAPEDELLDQLSGEAGFVYLARQVDADVGDEVEELGIAGVDTVAEPRRRYPQDELASQLLGAVGTDGYGLAGLEQAYEESLHGLDGRRRVVSDALGDPVSIVESEPVEAGDDLQLTIDAALQARVEDALAKVGEAYDPRGAHAIVIDPNTGEVLSLANWPAVDANDWAAAPDAARRNGAVSSSFEPGSTFKPFTVSGALEEEVVDPGTEFTLEPTITVADRVIGEAHERGTVELSVGEILAQSSNVGTVTIGMELGEERFDEWIRAFGFGEPTGVEAPGEAPGIVPPPEDYSGSSIGNLPIGQGLSVTPIQMVQGYSAIANEGVMRTPYVVEGGESEGRRVISEETAADVSKMLEGVLGPGGTAEEAQIAGYELAGKTGTAEKAIDGVYSDTKFFASFIGFAPAEAPELLVSVMVDEPQGSYYGGAVAAPAFEEIVSFALPYLRIAPR
ncbi:MAG: peptidoglycan D,D-transpeptidase FtsI family protein [Thermoleophilaceae bacterium]